MSNRNPQEESPQPRQRSSFVDTDQMPRVMQRDMRHDPTATSTHEFAQSPRRRGVGCWITGLATVFTVVILIGVGLLLPPFNLYQRVFGAQYITLSPQNNTVSIDGFNLSVDPAALTPSVIDDFGVALDSVSMQAYLNRDTSAGAWIAEAFAAQPPSLAIQSPVYTIDARGVTPEQVTISVDTPATVNTTDILDLYAYDSTRAEWRFIPAHPNANGDMTATLDDVPEYVALFQSAAVDQPRVLAAVDVTQVLTPDVAGLATIVSPAGLQPTLEGTLAGSLAAGFETNASYMVMPVVRNYTDPRAVDTATINTILNSVSLRNAHAVQLAGFVTSNGFDGVVIDYRDLAPDQRANFAAFITEVGRLTRGAGVSLGVVVPSAQNVGGVWDTGAYDWRAIGAAVDLMQITLPIDPTTYAPGADRLVEAMLRWGVGEVERGKILLGLSAQSVRETGGEYASISFDQALSALGDVSVEAITTDTGTVNPGDTIFARLDGYRAATGIDPLTLQTYIEYLDENQNPVARMWLTTPDTLRYRMDRGLAFGIHGVAFEDLLSGGLADGVLNTILNYKLQIPAQVGPQELTLRWTIEGTDGTIAEAFTGLNEELVATIQAPDGNYAVNVEVISGDGAGAARSGAAVAVFAPTNTPTPTLTPTPTNTPAPTNTPNRAAAVAPGSNPAVGNPAAAVRPVAGSITVGNFEYGGHVTSTGTGGAAAMQRAGMNWMKIQLRYAPGSDPGMAAGPISEAHARGFKILLGVVGYPNDLAAGGAGYVQGFASFLGGVAGLGPDAIEVWNEPNIDREWPAGQISGAGYADMLRQAYQAIKSANSSVMVISGAPAPTGAEAAFPGRVVNDDRFIRDMVAAGAVQWMDCLGAHYNEGVVGPNQRSGDPRDNYYTRYFFGMLDTYWNAIGGQRPICFTELGYLTPEGYPPLDPYFAWGANTTVGQQAAWLAEAIALASQSGRVRLLIVWNVDFDFYGTDPMAGFAIIRPGGGCPACDAIAGAR